MSYAANFQRDRVVRFAYRPRAQRGAEPWPPRLLPRIGIGGRLALGLAAVTAVILVGHALATRTTRQAAIAVRRMQTDSEPLAQRANTVLERLVAYDRSVSGYLQAGRSSDFGTIIASGNALQGAVASYYDGRPASAVTPAAAQLRLQLTNHIQNGQQLARSATQRVQWVDERNAALDRVYHYVSSAGGTGLAINGTQVVARRLFRSSTSRSGRPRQLCLRPRDGAQGAGFHGGARRPHRREILLLVRHRGAGGKVAAYGLIATSTPQESVCAAAGGGWIAKPTTPAEEM